MSLPSSTIEEVKQTQDMKDAAFRLLKAAMDFEMEKRGRAQGPHPAKRARRGCVSRHVMEKNKG